MQSQPAPTVAQDHQDPFAIFDDDGPIDPVFVTEAVRTLMRALPLESGEPVAWTNRRMYSAIVGLAALRPRDEIELLLAVQALSAYHAASASWYLGMNHHRPHGDSTRHVTTAATAARTFDTLLKALERRQVKPLAIPPGRPPSRAWPLPDLARIAGEWRVRCAGEDRAPEEADLPDWSGGALATATVLLDLDRIAQETEGLDIANTEGIRPDGSIIVPKDPTPQQQAYIARRIGLRLRGEWAENQRLGIDRMPKLFPIRPGDVIR